jgi:hypothetical protein
MRCWRVSMLAQRPLICGHRDTFDSRLLVVWQWDLSPSAPTWTFAWELPGLFGHLQNTFGRVKASWVWYPNWWGCLRWPLHGGEGSPPTFGMKYVFYGTCTNYVVLMTYEWSTCRCFSQEKYKQCQTSYWEKQMYNINWLLRQFYLFS